jgi:hypothetical protein
MPGGESTESRCYPQLNSRSGTRKCRRHSASLRMTTCHASPLSGSLEYPRAMKVAAVFRIGLTLPGVEESTAFGAPALKVKGKLMAAVPTNKSAEPGSLMFRVDREARAGLLAEAPEIYYCPDHYAGYDGVLVRLEQLTPEGARELLGMAHRFVTKTGSRVQGPGAKPSRKPKKG